MLVTRIFGNCPACGGIDKYGNVMVRGNSLLRGCLKCQYCETLPLPANRKKLLYLDQFFFSTAFQARDSRFVQAAKRIRNLSAMQLLTVPYSSVHEDETHQWRGYQGKDKDDLMEFVKETSRGYKFKPAWEVEQTQVVRGFKAFLAEPSSTVKLKQEDAIRGTIHEWDDYVRISVDRYLGDIELTRDLKEQAVQKLINAFEVGERQLIRLKNTLRSRYVKPQTTISRLLTSIVPVC